jgi:hypothetical protein
VGVGYSYLILEVMNFGTFILIGLQFGIGLEVPLQTFGFEVRKINQVASPDPITRSRLSVLARKASRKAEASLASIWSMP